MTDNTLSQLTLSMLHVDSIIDTSIAALDGDLFCSNTALQKENDNTYGDIISLEYNKTDNTIYFIFDNGNIKDIKMTPLIEFGRGSKGKRGDNGEPGDNGKDGRPGSDGDTGCPGMPGVIGKQGYIGEKGDKGRTGEKGIFGARGPVGLPGLKGYSGYPNSDTDDPCSTNIDPSSIGLQGEDGVNGIDITHYSFCRIDPPPGNICPYPVWGELMHPTPVCPDDPLIESPCVTVEPTPRQPCAENLTTPKPTTARPTTAKPTTTRPTTAKPTTTRSTTTTSLTTRPTTSTGMTARTSSGTTRGTTTEMTTTEGTTTRGTTTTATAKTTLNTTSKATTTTKTTTAATTRPTTSTTRTTTSTTRTTTTTTSTTRTTTSTSKATTSTTPPIVIEPCSMSDRGSGCSLGILISTKGASGPATITVTSKQTKKNGASFSGSTQTVLTQTLSTVTGKCEIMYAGIGEEPSPRQVDDICNSYEVKFTFTGTAPQDRQLELKGYVGFLPATFASTRLTGTSYTKTMTVDCCIEGWSGDMT